MRSVCGSFAGLLLWSLLNKAGCLQSTARAGLPAMLSRSSVSFRLLESGPQHGFDQKRTKRSSVDTPECGDNKVTQQKNTPAPAEVTSVTTASPDDPLTRKLAAEAAQAARTEYCSWCTQRGGSNGQLCRSNGVHYCRIVAAHQAGIVSDAHLIAVQIVLGSSAPHREMLLVFEPGALGRAQST